LSQEDHFRCGLQVRPQEKAVSELTGGKHITARGTLRVLLVFASFPDDTTHHPYWPVHQPPDAMRRFIDPDTVTRSVDPFNLTGYFREMSLGQFHLIGDVVWVESARSQNEYLNGSFGRANTDIIRERLDSLVDFSRYDQWRRLGDYRIAGEPDSVVDMIIMIWRTTLFQLYGEASLGYKPAIPVDGKWIEMGFPESYIVPDGSGITCQYPYGDDPPRLMKTIVHEIGHWLLGGLHPYSTAMDGKHQYWGLICAGQRLSSCINAFERERLGWISIPVVQPDQDIVLRDFVQSGDALKYHPPNGDTDEFFYFENHQRLSQFDDVTLNPDDTGIWILHQQHPYMELDNLRIRPSDGNWDWVNTGPSPACFGTSLPAFRRGDPRRSSGPSHRDQIPTQSSAVNWMYAFRGDTGSVVCAQFLGGESFAGAFDTASASVFSPYSNPQSATWNNQPTAFAFEVVRITDGAATVRAYSNPLDASPARRYLGNDPTASSLAPGTLAIAWGDEWSDGQSIEADIIASILERKSGDGPWETVYQGDATRWVDKSRHFDSSGTDIVAFRVRVQDNQGQFSRWSNVLLARAAGPTGVAWTGDPEGLCVRLEEAYPNPFNPATSIGYTVGVVSRQSLVVSNVKLAVYDLLGREVAVLVDEQKQPGEYTATWDARGKASGVYFFRLMAGDVVETKQMLLLR